MLAGTFMCRGIQCECEPAEEASSWAMTQELEVGS